MGFVCFFARRLFFSWLQREAKRTTRHFCCVFRCLLCDKPMCCGRGFGLPSVLSSGRGPQEHCHAGCLLERPARRCASGLLLFACSVILFVVPNQLGEPQAGFGLLLFLECGCCWGCVLCWNSCQQNCILQWWLLLFGGSLQTQKDPLQNTNTQHTHTSNMVVFVFGFPLNQPLGRMVTLQVEPYVRRKTQPAYSAGKRRIATGHGDLRHIKPALPLLSTYLYVS